MAGIYELTMAVFLGLAGLFLGFVVTAGNLLAGVGLCVVFLSVSGVVYLRRKKAGASAAAAV